MSANEPLVAILLPVRVTSQQVDENASLRVGLSSCPKIKGSQSA